MSDTDSFIEEVTEEVRRDRLFALMRRYGWIAVLAVVLIVGGAAWNEWNKAQARNSAQSLGDSVLAALQLEERDARAAALSQIEAPNAASGAMLGLLAAAEEGGQDPAAAAQRLLTLADSNDVAPVYRQIAVLKAVALRDSGLSVEDRRARLEPMALDAGLAGLLAQEQLALIELDEGNTDAAIERLSRIAADATVSAGLRNRATQLIIALGGDLPEAALTE